MIRKLRWKLAGKINDLAIDAKTDKAADLYEWLYEKVLPSRIERGES